MPADMPIHIGHAAQLTLLADGLPSCTQSVAYLHNLSLVHTDLKPENILLVNNQYKKLNNNK